MPAKYEPLEQYLHAIPLNVQEVTLSFPEIERILGAPLPKSSTKHPAWWRNQVVSKSLSQAHAWLSAGFLIDAVNQRRSIGSVRFKRK
jgi:putative restriction endonuclease